MEVGHPGFRVFLRDYVKKYRPFWGGIYSVIKLEINWV